MYRQLAYCRALEDLCLDEDELSERCSIFELFSDRFLRELKLRCLEEGWSFCEWLDPLLVGGLAVKVFIDTPCFDLLIPCKLPGSELVSKPRNGCVRVVMSPDHPNATRPFFKDQLFQAGDFVKTFHRLFMEMSENMENLTKMHRLSTEYDKARSRVRVDFHDERIGSVTLTCFLEVVLLVPDKDGILHHVKPTHHGTVCQLCYSVRDRDLLSVCHISASLPAPDSCCRLACLRLLKAYIHRRCPQLGSTYAMTTVFLHELRRTHNSDQHWTMDQLPQRFIDILQLFLGGVSQSKIWNYHSLELGGELNVLADVPPEVLASVAANVAADLDQEENILHNMNLPDISKSMIPAH